MTKEEIIRNLKYTMEKHKNDTVSTFGTNISVMCKDILDYLEQEPSRVKSKWIHRHVITRYRNFDEVVCKNCGEEFSFDYETGKQIEHYNYCPNCGADMRE